MKYSLITIALSLAASVMMSCTDMLSAEKGEVGVNVRDVVSTRGQVIGTASVKDYSFLLDGYLQSTNRYDGTPNGRMNDESDATNYHFINGEEVYYSSSRWKMDNTYYWRNAVPAVIWANCPVSVNGTLTRTLPSSDAGDSQQLAMKLDYSLPIPDLQDDALAADDILVAMSRYTWTEGANSDGIVDIAFQHALSAVRFDVSGVSGVTVKNITLQGMALEGTCSISPKSSADNTLVFNWESEVNPSSFSIGQDYAAADFLSGLVKESSGKYFFTIPQTMTSSARLVVTFETSSHDTFTRSASIYESGSKVIEWKAGKLYTYAITQNGEDDPVFEISSVTVSDWNPGNVISQNI